MNTQEILERITTLRDKLNTAIYSGRSYNTVPNAWSVSFEYRDSIVKKLEVEGKGPTFDEALKIAWGHLQSVTDFGVSNALTPLVEHKELKQLGDPDWERPNANANANANDIPSDSNLQGAQPR
jgi:hypothetical protein